MTITATQARPAADGLLHGMKRPAAAVKRRPAAVKRRPAAVNTAATSAPLCFSLGSDDLVQVVARVPSSSFRALAATCKLLRSILEEDSFLGARVDAGCCEVSVRMARSQRGDYDETRALKATLQVDARKMGILKAHLVDRTACQEQGQALFFNACDAESQDLVDVAGVLFDSDGCPRYQDLVRDPKTSSGGFLYIAKLKLTCSLLPNYATWVAAQAIKAFLEHSRVKKKWTVAAYVSLGEADCRPFIQARFNEIRRNKAWGNTLTTSWLYTTKFLQGLGYLTHEEAMGVELFMQRGNLCPNAGTTMRDVLLETLDRAQLSSEEHEALRQEIELHNFRSTLPQVDGTSSLHVAAYLGLDDLVVAALHSGTDVDARDKLCRTLLMNAALGVGLSEQPRYRCMETLLNRGASLTLEDNTGQTALAIYKDAVQEFKDFHLTFQLPTNKHVDAEVVAKLTPRCERRSTDRL